jgi:uncharacterized protein
VNDAAAGSVTDAHRLTSVAELREIYADPHPLVLAKERGEMDEATRRLVDRARFVLLGTYRADGSADVSPRGGEPGFVRTLDETRLALADLGGNNRIDSLRNIVETGHVGMLFVAPGQSETVRINGEAWVTTDPQLLGGYTLARCPKAAIVVRVTATFIHCAKAFRRSGMWDPDIWAQMADTPDAAEILVCQNLLGEEVTAAEVRADLDNGYDEELAWEAGKD